MTPKELATRWFTEIWNGRNPGVIHELMHPECLGHTEAGTLVGPDAFVTHMYEAFTAAFPDIQLELHQVVAEGEDTVGRWTVRGTHTGELGGMPPTGRKIQFSGMTWLKFRDGKLIEGADSWNANALACLLANGTESASVKSCG